MGGQSKESSNMTGAMMLARAPSAANLLAPSEVSMQLQMQQMHQMFQQQMMAQRQQMEKMLCEAMERATNVCKITYSEPGAQRKPGSDLSSPGGVNRRKALGDVTDQSMISSSLEAPKKKPKKKKKKKKQVESSNIDDKTNGAETSIVERSRDA